MAVAPSPGEIVALIKYAVDLCQRCAAAPEEFKYASIEVEATSLNFRAARRLLENSHSAIYKKENIEFQRALRTHCNNCRNALKDVELILVKYEQMALTDKFLWAVKGKGDLDKVMVHVDFVTTRMEGFLNVLDKSLITAGKIERHLDRTGDAEKAVQRSTSGRADVSDKDRQSFSSYACRLSQAKEKARYHNHGAAKPPTRRPGCYLECWVVKRVSSPGFETTKKSLMKSAEQKRGQWKLEEMAKQFKNHSGNKKLLLERDDDRVEWILKEKRRHEKDAKFEWKFAAARVESKTASALGLVVEERVMVIIRRRMTQKAEAELRKKEEKKEKAKREAAEREKQKAAKKKAAEEVAKEMAEEKVIAEAKAKDKEQHIDQEVIKKAVAQALKEEREKEAKKKEGERKAKEAAQKKAKNQKAVPLATTEQHPGREAKHDKGQKAEPKKDKKRVPPLATTENKAKNDTAQRAKPKKDPATGSDKPNPPKPTSPKLPEKKDGNATAGHFHGEKENQKVHDDGKKHVHWDDAKKGGKKP